MTATFTDEDGQSRSVLGFDPTVAQDYYLSQSELATLAFDKVPAGWTVTVNATDKDGASTNGITHETTKVSYTVASPDRTVVIGHTFDSTLTDEEKNSTPTVVTKETDASIELPKTWSVERVEMEDGLLIGHPNLISSNERRAVYDDATSTITMKAFDATPVTFSLALAEGAALPTTVTGMEVSISSAPSFHVSYTDGEGVSHDLADYDTDGGTTILPEGVKVGDLIITPSGDGWGVDSQAIGEKGGVPTLLVTSSNTSGDTISHTFIEAASDDSSDEAPAPVVSHSVTFVNGNGMGSSTVSVDDGQKVVVTSNPMWTGHTFLGWNTAEDGSGEAFDPETTTITSDLTVYGQWKAQEGADGEERVISSTIGDDDTDSKDIDSKDGGHETTAATTKGVAAEGSAHDDLAQTGVDTAAIGGIGSLMALMGAVFAGLRRRMSRR